MKSVRPSSDEFMKQTKHQNTNKKKLLLFNIELNIIQVERKCQTHNRIFVKKIFGRA